MNIDSVVTETRLRAYERLKSQANPLSLDELGRIADRFEKGFRNLVEGPVSIRDWWTAFREDDVIDVADSERAPRQLVYDRAQLDALPMAPAMMVLYGYALKDPANIFEKDALNALWNEGVGVLRCRRLWQTAIAA